MKSLRISTPRRSRPAMFPRWIVNKFATFREVQAYRPYLRRAPIRSNLLWVRMLQKQRRKR